jgi:phosphopantothenoylcysteine decarboxylase/phosphopantothenate--cysteine ligase
MSSPRQIFSYLKNYFDKKDIVKKKNLKALVTTGPTREYLDPVRYISNESSGKQGYEIAVALNKLGIKTTVIAGPSNYKTPKDIKVKKVTSADEMMLKVKDSLPVDLAVCAAAVADFKPIQKKNKKIKKDEIESNSIILKKNNDILEYLSKNNKNRPRIVAGFAAETENLTKNSLSKIKNKHCDFIFANDVSKKNFGFNSDYNKVTMIDKKGNIKHFPKNKKSFIANRIAQILLDKLLDDRNFN